MRQWRTHEERNQVRSLPDELVFHSELTRRCDAVESNKGVKAGGGSWQDPRPSKGHEPTGSQAVPAQQQVCQAEQMENTSVFGFISGELAYCPLPCSGHSLLLLEAGITGGVIGLQDLIRVDLPVLDGPFDQTGDHHEQQDENVDAGEDLVHHRWLFDAEREQTWEEQTTRSLQSLSNNIREDGAERHTHTGQSDDDDDGEHVRVLP